MLWFIFAVMSVVVLGALLRPLLALTVRDTPSAEAGGSAVFRHQLAEIESDAERGLIEPAEAEAARREVARRLLAAADATVGLAPSLAKTASPPTAAIAARDAGRLAALIAVAVPIAAIALYAVMGAPQLPSQPFASRAAPPPANPELTRLITAVEQRLQAHPEDGRGWDVIAPVYLRLGRFKAAADAYTHAMTLLGETPPRLAGLAEALMLASDGRVTPEARTVLEKLVAREPGHVQARFWLAFAKEQDGHLAEAAADYAQLLTEAPADASWRPMVVERQAAVRAALAGKPAAKADAPSPPLPPSLPGAAGAQTSPSSTTTTPPVAAASAPPPGPSPTDIAAAERLTPADRQAMIERMVAGLDQRLAKDGRDLAGWQRLIRALVVLGRKDQAAAALGRARTAFAGQPQPLTELADLAKTLGLGS